MGNQPTITSKNLPKTPVGAVTPIEDIKRAFVPDSQIEAKPLGMPTFDKVISKNPNLSFRWVNRAVGNGNNQSFRYDQTIAQGFRPATPADCTVQGMSPRDGHWLNGDVILMCIAREQYVGALNWNQQQAKIKANAYKRGAVPNVVGTDKSQVGVEATEQQLVQAPPALKTKISSFVPDEAQAEALNSSDDAKTKAILEGKL